MKTRKSLLFIVLASLVALFASCDEKGQEVPSYLTIDAITVKNDPSVSLSYYSGFFSSEIDAVQVILYFDGDAEETNLGVFQLPCKIPVLRKGTAKYVQITPVVLQNGIVSTRIYYPFYEILTVDNVTLSPDSVTSLGSLETKYKSSVSVKWKEFFEPQSFSFLLDPDSVITVISDLDTVCSDYGCAVIRVPSTKNTINFWIDEPVELPTADLYVYLELDYMSDISFSVGFNNPTTSGGSSVIQSMEVLHPSDHWQKMYINMGRLWNYYNYYPYIRLYFSILNDSGKEGNVYLDNMKVVAI